MHRNSNLMNAVTQLIICNISWELHMIGVFHRFYGFNSQKGTYLKSKRVQKGCSPWTVHIFHSWDLFIEFMIFNFFYNLLVFFSHLDQKRSIRWSDTLKYIDAIARTFFRFPSVRFASTLYRPEGIRGSIGKCLIDILSTFRKTWPSYGHGWLTFE